MIFVHLHIVNSHRCTGAQNLILFFPNNVQAASLNVVTGKLPVTTCFCTENQTCWGGLQAEMAGPGTKHCNQSELINWPASLPKSRLSGSTNLKLNQWQLMKSAQATRSHKTSKHDEEVVTKHQGKTQALTSTLTCFTNLLKPTNHKAGS